jgi:hypothetical protein
MRKQEYLNKNVPNKLLPASAKKKIKTFDHGTNFNESIENCYQNNNLCEETNNSEEENIIDVIEEEVRNTDVEEHENYDDGIAEENIGEEQFLNLNVKINTQEALDKMLTVFVKQNLSYTQFMEITKTFNSIIGKFNKNYNC